MSEPSAGSVARAKDQIGRLLLLLVETEDDRRAIAVKINEELIVILDALDAEYARGQRETWEAAAEINDRWNAGQHLLSIHYRTQAAALRAAP